MSAAMPGWLRIAAVPLLLFGWPLAGLAAALVFPFGARVSYAAGGFVAGLFLGPVIFELVKIDREDDHE